MAVEGYAKFEGVDDTPLRPDSPRIAAALDGQYAPLSSDRFTFRPLRNVTVTPITSEGSRYIVGAIGNYLYASVVATGDLFRSTDGTTWTELTGAGSLQYVRSLKLMGNGEVAANTLNGIYTSTGWASNQITATWTLRKLPSSGATILPWGFDVYENLILASEYAVAPRDPSDFVYLSQDYGATWSNVLSLDVLYPGTDDGDSVHHWHAACIDHFVTPSPRLWVSQGDADSCLRYSDDLGDTWTVLPGGRQPTTIRACAAGIVTGSDQGDDGVWRVLRTTDPADMVHEPIHRIATGRASSTLGGFAWQSEVDPDTGIVYTIWRSDLATLPSRITASDGYNAATVWEHDQYATGVALAVHSGRIYAGITNTVDSAGQTVRADASKLGSLHFYDLNKGNALYGVADNYAVAVGLNSVADFDSVAIGPNADSDTFERSVAIGAGADAGANDTVVIGRTASSGANQNVAIGSDASAVGDGSIAIGYQATSAATNGTIIGKSSSGPANSVIIGSSVNASAAGSGATIVGYANTTSAAASAAATAFGNGNTITGDRAVALGSSNTASATFGIAIGNIATATSGTYATAIGRAANATGQDATALGRSAAATSTDAIAIGRSVTAAHLRSVAIGFASATTVADQVTFGPRHIEITEVTAPSAPAANAARLYTADNGAGKTQLCVRFATGAVQVLATEP